METSSSRGYEFTPGQNETLGTTARWVGIWAWFAIAAGAFMIVGGLFTLPQGIANLVLGGVYLFVGISFRGAAGSLRSVVETAGSDVDHLMSALESLRTAFKVMVILTAVGILAGVVLAVFGAGGGAAAGG